MTPSQAAVCKNILETGRSLLEISKCVSCPHPPKASPRSPPPIPNFPPLPNVDEILSSQNLPIHISTQIASIFHRTAMELQENSRKTLVRAIEDYPDVPGRSLTTTNTSIQRMIQVFQNQYQKTLYHMLDSYVQKACELSQRQVTGAAHKPRFQKAKCKSSFNSEYLPLLEKYFEINPFPSAPDRALLARKSMMTPRQIEVWFQNHRNRARKEGRHIHRVSPAELPLRIPLESPEEKMPFFAIPHQRVENCERSPATESDNEDTMTVPVLCPHILAPPAPPHSFPTTFKESVNYATFIPKSDHFSAPPISWARKPTFPIRKRKLSVDMDDLCSDFMGRLSLCGPVPKKLKQHINPSPQWFAHKQTVPAPAPHPAFIRSLSYVKFPPAAAARTSSPAQVAHRHAFRSPTPNTPLTPLVPARSIGEPRKVARLPRRTPNYASLTHRAISPAISDPPSPSPSSPANSRASSFNSSISARRLSSSSCSSAASSTLTTPVTITKELPGVQVLSVNLNDSFDDSYEDLFGDSRHEIGPPITRHLSSSPGSRKLSFNYDFVSSPHA